MKTSAYLVEKLRALGLEVRTGLAMTGFRADIDTGRPGPTVAFLGEMDSLVLPNHPECDPVTGAAHENSKKQTMIFNLFIAVFAEDQIQKSSKW